MTRKLPQFCHQKECLKRSIPEKWMDYQMDRLDQPIPMEVSSSTETQLLWILKMQLLGDFDSMESEDLTLIEIKNLE